MGAGPASPSATASLSPIPLAASSADVTVQPNPALTADSLLGAATWAESAGFDLETLQGYQAVGAITPWTATRWDGQQDCVLLTMNAGEIFSHVACVLQGRAATLGDRGRLELLSTGLLTRPSCCSRARAAAWRRGPSISDRVLWSERDLRRHSTRHRTECR